MAMSQEARMVLHSTILGLCNAYDEKRHGAFPDYLGDGVHDLVISKGIGPEEDRKKAAEAFRNPSLTPAGARRASKSALRGVLGLAGPILLLAIPALKEAGYAAPQRAAKEWADAR